jgi:hypothetical protein
MKKFDLVQLVFDFAKEYTFEPVEEEIEESVEDEELECCCCMKGVCYAGD